MDYFHVTTNLICSASKFMFLILVFQFSFSIGNSVV
eukprot:UN21776